MAQTTYPDGFPLTPIEAIEFSYTFSDAEKQEWREWVKTATPEQQQELVETLHAIWQDNQKEVIPAGFDKKETTVEAAPTSAPVTQPKQQAPVPPVQVVQEITKPDSLEELPKEFVAAEIKPFVGEPKIEQVVEAVMEKPVETPKKEFVFNEGDTPIPTPPVEQQKTEQKPQQVSQNNSRQENREQRPQRDNNQNRQNQPQNRGNNQQNTFQNQSQQTQSFQQKPQQQLNPVVQNTATELTITNEEVFFDFAKAKESGSKKMLEQLQREFVTARQKKVEIEANYREQLAQSTKEMEQKQFALMDKVIDITLNFEYVSDIFETMTSKLVEMNNKVMELSKDVKSIKNATSGDVTDMRDDVESIQRDVDRMYRDIKDMRIESRDKYRELSDKVESNNTDSLGQFGINQKLALMQSKLDQLQKSGENQQNRSQNQNNNQQKPKRVPQPIVEQYEATQPEIESVVNTEQNQDQQKPQKNSKKEAPVIDLREMV
jgi:hypothetical protein